VIPILGLLVAAAILAYSRWPTIDAARVGGTTNV
jgi:hypothetical protein